MVQRAIIGLLIGLILGSIFGVISMFIMQIGDPLESFEGRIVSIQGTITWNTVVGFILFGLPSSAVAAMVAGFNFNEYKSAIVGAVFGLLLILTANLYYWQKGEYIIFEKYPTGWTSLQGRHLFFQLLFISVLTIVPTLVSAMIKRRETPVA